jgi:DNA polymerase-1
MGSPPIEIITDVDEAMRMLDGDREIALDIETDGLEFTRDVIAVLAMHGESSNATCVLHLRGIMPPKLAKWLSRKNVRFTVHYGVGFDLAFLYRAGVDIDGPEWYDTHVGESVVHTTGRRDVSMSLKNSLRRRIGKRIDKEVDHASWMNPTLDSQQLDYVVDDIVHLHKLRHVQVQKCMESSQHRALDLEMEIVPLVAGMTIRGFPVDLDRLNEYVVTRLQQSEDLERTLQHHLGDINFGSPVQVKRALTAHGFRLANTRKETLGMAARLSTGIDKEILEGLVEFRESRKASMYGTSWVSKHVVDGRIHARWWQCGTDTTRFSSSDPNMQQIPKKMRSVFGSPGRSVIAADYSQIEIRAAASISNDKALLRILEQSDVHTAIASQVFRVPPEEITSDQRSLSKALSFTLLFAGAAPTLYKYARIGGSNITMGQAEDLKDRFFERFRGLAYTRSRAFDVARRGGVRVVTLPTGHRRVLVGRNLTPQRLLNTAVQGAAAAGIKHALLECHRAGLPISLQVHDELVLEVPDNEVKDAEAEMRRCMLEGMSKAISAPVSVEVNIDKYWS